MVKVGLVGCGFMGTMHANVYSVLDGADLVGVFDKSPDRASEFAAKWGGRVYGSYDEMIVEVDMVDICLPTYLHADFTVKACEAGKHVMCEKPMALSVSDADRMVEASKKAGVKLMVGHCIRFWPEYEELKAAVDDGRLGALLSANFTRYGAFPSYTVDQWAAEPELCGGAMDMHIHDTDFALYLLGSPDHTVSHGSKDSRGVGHFFTTMRFGGVVVQLEGGWNLPQGNPFRMEYRAVFDRGSMIYRDGELMIYEEGKDPVKHGADQMEAEGASGNLSSLGGYYNELAYLVDCIENDTPLVTVTPESSRESLRVVLDEVAQIESKLS
ncbi:MAG: Gfo/Idh/MocA family oxidoreductase [Armatimonadetes bacterium]|nr:Gfo/Idh/MocA family oxidoreductase [Armatimonadota bacterium]